MIDWIDNARDVVSQCAFPGYTFHVKMNGRGDLYLQGEYAEPDAVVGVILGAAEVQLTRRWFLSPKMSDSEIVQTVFKCVITSMEHRTREWFTWKERPIFHPHHNLQRLWEICETRETRETNESTTSTS